MTRPDYTPVAAIRRISSARADKHERALVMRASTCVAQGV